MDEHLSFLRTLSLFRDMTDEAILEILSCLHARKLHLEQDRILWEIGKNAFIAIVLEGTIALQRDDWHGNRSIVNDFHPGDFITNSMLCAIAGARQSFLNATVDANLIVLDYEPVANGTQPECMTQTPFLRNMVNALLEKEKAYQHKIEYLSKRTTREKLISYLTMLAADQGTRRIDVPYSRQELADLLAVDRSAMCTELTRMQNDGLIRYERRRFELIHQQ